MRHEAALIIVLAVLASVAMIVGAVLASREYSSSGAFSIAAACVGVLGTLAAQRANGQAKDE